VGCTGAASFNGDSGISILTVGQIALGQIVNTQAGVTLALKPF
jgi:hypothetical protein